ncbi:hypothetical protein F4859DRAFT_484661 [Xylaria cf. heliscus]|nr:hypothetical protein F4859DRAFT_484661 [Xylaria cf. heliscus]
MYAGLDFTFLYCSFLFFRSTLSSSLYRSQRSQPYTGKLLLVLPPLSIDSSLLPCARRHRLSPIMLARPPRLVTGSLGALGFQFLVEGVSGVGAGHVVSVPVSAAHRHSDTKADGQVDDEAPFEHTSNGLDGHCDEGIGGLWWWWW